MSKSRKIIISVTSIIMTLLTLELLLRLTVIPIELDTRYKRNDLQWIQKDVILNSYGYRDKEYSEEKNEDIFRIYSLGDSYTFGWYIPDIKNTYPKLLENYLNRDLGKKAEVINASTPGFSLRESVDRYVFEGKRFHPDIVTIGLNYGDFITTGSRTGISMPDIPIISASYLYRLTVGSFLRKIDSDTRYKYLMNIFQNPQSPDWEGFVNDMLMLKEEAAKSNATLAIVLFPKIDPYNPNQGYQFKPMHEKVASFAKEYGIFLIDPLKRFEDYSKKELLVLNPLDAHPTELALQFTFQEFLKTFDFKKYLTTHEPFVPSSKAVTITSNQDKIGSFDIIKQISSTEADLPWVYFDERYGEKLQKYPLKDVSQRQSKIYADYIYISKALDEENVGETVGVALEYHVLGKNYKNGQITVPDKIGSFSIIGIENIVGFYNEKGGGAASEFIAPKLISKKENYMTINFDSKHDFYEFRLILDAGIKQLNIKDDGTISDVARTISLHQKLEKNTSKISFLVSERLSGIPTFTENPTTNYHYAFVNDSLIKLEDVEIQSGAVNLTFGKELHKGDSVVFPAFVSYTIDGNEVLFIETQ